MPAFVGLLRHSRPKVAGKSCLARTISPRSLRATAGSETIRLTMQPIVKPAMFSRRRGNVCQIASSAKADSQRHEARCQHLSDCFGTPARKWRVNRASQEQYPNSIAARDYLAMTFVFSLNLPQRIWFFKDRIYSLMQILTIGVHHVGLVCLQYYSDGFQPSYCLQITHRQFPYWFYFLL